MNPNITTDDTDHFTFRCNHWLYVGDDGDETRTCLGRCEVVGMRTTKHPRGEGYQKCTSFHLRCMRCGASGQRKVYWERVIIPRATKKERSHAE